jgi:hypothetical protein
VIEVSFCPRCEGQRSDVDACGLCGNIGLLDQHGDPLRLPLQEALVLCSAGPQLRAVLEALEAS